MDHKLTDENKDHDVIVLSREDIDVEYADAFDKEFVVQFADGTVEQFDTENEACARQREWRELVGLDPETGE